MGISSQVHSQLLSLVAYMSQDLAWCVPPPPISSSRRSPFPLQQENRKPYG